MRLGVHCIARQAGGAEGSGEGGGEEGGGEGGGSKGSSEGGGGEPLSTR